MPKLPKAAAKRASEAEDVQDGFAPLPAGKYICTLAGVEDRKSEAGNDMWGIELEDLFDLEGNEQPGRQFTNVVMAGGSKVPDDYKGKPNSKKSLEEQWKSRNAFLDGKIKQFFKAFGFTTDSDTDEMIGERCVISLSIETIGKGKRAGQLGNQVTGFYTLDSVDAEDPTSDADDEF